MKWESSSWGKTRGKAMDKVKALDEVKGREKGRDKEKEKEKDGDDAGRNRVGWVVGADESGGGDPEWKGDGEADVPGDGAGRETGGGDTTEGDHSKERGWMSGWF